MVMNSERFLKSQSKSKSMEADIVEESLNGRFIRYDEELGCGAFKVVYRGFDKDTGREIAWSQIFVDDDDDALKTEKLLQEAVILKVLNHENVIKCYHCWVDKKNKTINMITELCSSGNLCEYRMKHKGVDMKAIKSWARQILQGLHCLHSHNPPIIHRDLKCENIFVSGNHGKIKIGDLGLAAVMQKGVSLSVVGTPEFMAPEVYDEDYSQLADIYSFGMCMLELITCECPYSECQNPGQVYKKVISGIKPAALQKVKDPQVKQFIERCLGPASQRLPAAELLKDPFLSADNSKEFLHEHVQLSPDAVPESIKVSKSDSQVSMEVDPKCSKLSGGTSTRSTNEPRLVPEVEIWSSGKMFAYRLRGEKMDDHSIKCMFLIADYSRGWGRELEFIFRPEMDTAVSVAFELVQYQDLPAGELPVVANLMDSLYLKLVPGWRPAHGYHGESSHEDPASLQINQDSLGNPAVDDHANEGSTVSDMSLKSSVTSASDASCNELSRPADNSTDECIKGSKDYGAERCESDESVITSDFVKNLEISSVDSNGIISNDVGSSISSVSMAEKDQCYGLMLDLDAIEAEYQQCCHQLLRMREEAIENAQKRWF